MLSSLEGELDGGGGHWEGGNLGKVGVGGKVLFGKVMFFFGGGMGFVLLCVLFFGGGGGGVGQQKKGYTLKKDVGGWLFFCFFLLIDVCLFSFVFCFDFCS